MMTLIGFLVGATFLICLGILGWIAMDYVYETSPGFRKTWAQTGLQFPHTFYSSYWRGRRDYP
jgi:hypothetical protein